MDDLGDDLSICSDIEDEANISYSMVLPEKSRKRYESAYEGYKKYCEKRNAGTSESELLTYFLERAEILKSPSSLWCEYSMLKTTLFINEKIDISLYPKLKAFLKGKNSGYRPKKSKTFTREEIYTFLTQACDDIYLMLKVALIMGLAGACRRDELCKMRIDDVEDKDTVIIVKVRDSKNKTQRTFTIIDNARENIHAIALVKRYIHLRPKHTESQRFFMRYHLGKCVNQVVGINTFAKIPSQIAKFLNLEHPNEFTGHSFRRTSAALMANTGVGILGGWKFSSVIEDLASCGATDCKHNNLKDSCTFFRLPTDPKLRDGWLQSVRRDSRIVPKVMFVCSCHFRGGEEKNGPELFLPKDTFNQKTTSLAKLKAEKSNVELESKPSTSAASNEEFLVENSSDLPIEHVDVGSTSCEETTDPDLDFLPESDEPSLPKCKRQKFVAAKDVKSYCRLCLNPATKNQMVCLGDFHDINYPSRTVQFKRNKILQTDMYLRMIRTLMPNFNHDLVYNPIMCNGCSTRLQMASDFVEQCMATQNLIQQYKDTYCPAEKLVSCEDVVHNKSHLQPANNQDVPSNPKKRKIAKPVPEQPTETVSYNEDFQTLENVNVKTEQFEEMENEEKYEITPEEVCNIKQEFVEEETMIRTNETEITLPVDTVVKNEPCSTEISDYNIIANEQTSIKQFSNSNIDIPTTEVDSIYNTNLVGTHVPAQFCPPTLPPQYCPPNQPVASETFVSLVNPVTTQSVASNNVDLSHNYQNS